MKNNGNRLPTFYPTAHPANMAKVRRGVDEAGSREIYGGTGKPLCPHLGKIAVDTLDRFHSEYEAASFVPVEEISQISTESRGDLVLQAHQLFLLHAVHRVADESKEDMEHASLAGCGVTVAYLEMIARKQAQVGWTEGFNEESYRDSVKKSLPNLMMMAATSNGADGAVTEVIMNWTPKQVKYMNDRDVYAGLQLNEDFFDMQDDGAVWLKQDEATRKLMRRGFDFSPNKNLILFGCPFRSRIPLLYDAMTEAMLSNGFAEDAYNFAYEASSFRGM